MFVVVRFVRGFYEEGGTGVIGLRSIVVSVVRRIDCSVFLVVSVVRGFYGVGGDRFI